MNRLDFATKGKIKVDKIDNDLSDYTFVLINTGGSHADLTDEYASIPKEMFAVANKFNKERLVDIPEKDFFNNLNQIQAGLPDRAILRACHFYEENERVECVYKALKCGNYEAFLKAVNESGISSLCKLQNCYVAGSNEQPIVKALSISARYLNGGANRVHGGGFAGSILNIIKNSDVNAFIERMKEIYSEENIIPLKIRSVGTIVL